MRTYLVLANQTLGGQELHDAIYRRIEEGPSEFRVVVPVTRARDYAAAVGASGSGAAFPIPGQGSGPSTDDMAWEHARDRMNHLVGEIRDRGATAEGVLGDSDPYAAFKNALESGTFDEVILSTLPSGVSKWLGMDLPSRVERTFDGPVTTIISGG